MRLDRVVKKIVREGLDGFLFSSQPSVFYLSQFSSTHAYVLLTAGGKRVLITDGRYILKAEKFLSPLGWEVKEVSAPLFENLTQIIADYGVKKLGVEGDRLKLDFFEKFKCKAGEKGIKVIPYGGFLDEFRMVKTPEEIEKIARAVEITEKVFLNLVEFLKENRKRLTQLTEQEIRSFLVCQYLREGAKGESFPTIVASGENSAIPHHETGDTPLRENSLLLIDTGVVWEGYCSDFTRTLFIGKPDRELVKVYDIVREAHLRALEAVKAGRPIKEVDLAAREYIASKGYGEFFTHSTGHGVGIEIHEPPRVYKSEETPMAEGMVFTIEPGIYLPGKGGVRLENIVVVTNEGAKVLQKTPLEPIEI
jgi:Xaa-Pro aminopeptidase/Xaa-Pro dipeptidase